MYEVNRIYNEDAFEAIKKIPDKSIDLIITDPPYEIQNKGGGLYIKEDKKYVKELEKIKDSFDFKILEEFVRVMKKINIYVWCSQKQLLPLIKFFVEEKGCNYNLITWHKTNPIPACGNKYLTDTEYCLFFREKGVKVYGNFETKKTYYSTPLNVGDKNKFFHPTIKPLFIIENLIENSSQDGEVVLDPFMGSGTTAVACQNKKRKFLGFEIEKKYCDIANCRINGQAIEYEELEGKKEINLFNFND